MSASSAQPWSRLLKKTAYTDHPSCFVCTNCSLPLPDFHFLLDGLPYCEQHATEEERFDVVDAYSSNKRTSGRKAEKRRTVVGSVANSGRRR